MEYYKKELCITYAELTSLMKADTLRQNIKRGNITRVRRGGLGHPALYSYASLPPRYRALYESSHGSALEVLKREELRSSVAEDPSARRWFEGYEYTLNGVRTHLSEKMIDEYTMNASVLNVLLDRLNDVTANRHALGSSRSSDIWDIIYTQSEELRSVTGHTLPGNATRLREKVNRYKKEGYGVLINGRLGNSNTLKITQKAAKRLIALKRSKVPVLTDSQIFETFNAEAEARGLKPLKSIRSLKTWLESPQIEPLWHDAVYGEQSSHQKFDRKMKTALPTRRDTLWYGDGTKLNLYYRDESGKVRTTSVYEVIDAYSEMFLGFCISDNEDYEAQYMAYRMAIQVSKHKPYEIVSDNQGGHKKLESQGFLQKLCRVYRTTAPYNGSSKTIESVFGRFQQQVLHKDWRFTGQNITAKKQMSRPDIEFIEANKDKLYTLDELKAAYVKARNEWNEMAHPKTGMAREEMYRTSSNDGTPEVTARDMEEMFWVWTDKPCTFTASGLEITIKGKKRTYEVFSSPGVPDHEWRRTHTYEKFYVKYDPYDYTSIRLYRKDKSGELRFERVAEPYMTIHRALQDQTEGEAKFIRAEERATEQERIERQVAAKTIEREEGVLPEQHGLRSPKLKGVRAEVQHQIDRRTGIYSGRPYELSLGRATKVVSNIDWTEIESPVEINRRKTAEKL